MVDGLRVIPGSLRVSDSVFSVSDIRTASASRCGGRNALLPAGRRRTPEASHAVPAGGRRLPPRGADGPGGVQRHLGAALPPPLAVGLARHRGADRRGRARPWVQRGAPSEPPAAALSPAHRRPDGGFGERPRPRPSPAARQRRRAPVVRAGHDDRAPSIATPSATNSSTCTRVRRCWRACTARSTSAPATTSSSRPSTTHRWVVEEPAEALIFEARGHVRLPGSLPVAVRPAPRGRAVQRARLPRPGRAAARRRRGRAGARADPRRG